MKSIKKLVVTALCALSLVCILPMNVLAASDYLSGNYTYTIRVYTGAQGVFSDGSTEMIIKAAPGTVIDLSKNLAGIAMNTAKDAAGNTVANKYYAKGIRESGKDNNTVGATKGTTFRVTKDLDYVVAYAMEGGDIAYTVKYVEKSTGKSLLPDATFYGNEGEKPVVAYQYIDGYIPQAYNLTKTLKAGEENVFTFYYVPGDSSKYDYTYTDGGTRIEYYDGGTIVTEVPGVTVTGGGGGVTVIVDNGTTGGRTGGATGGAANAADAGTAGGAAGGTDGADAGATSTAAPAELIDIDDESVPLASAGLDYDYIDGTASKIGFSQLPLGAKIALIGLGAVAIAGCTFLGVNIVAKRKKSKVTNDR